MQEQGTEEEEAARRWRLAWTSSASLPLIVEWPALRRLSCAMRDGEYGAVSVVGHIRGETNTMPLHSKRFTRAIRLLPHSRRLAAGFAGTGDLAGQGGPRKTNQE